MSNCCPYCGSENFEAEAAVEKRNEDNEPIEWVNKCRNGCGQYSVYREATGNQVELPIERRDIG